MSDTVSVAVPGSAVDVTSKLFHGGTVSLPSGTDVSVSWSTFPNAVDGIVVTGLGGPVPDVFAFDLTTSGCKLNSGGAGGTVTVSWLAFGH